MVHCHLAARASLLEVSRQLGDPGDASRGELHARTHFLRTTDIHSQVRVLWVNVYGFQARDASKQRAQWAFIGAVLDRWQSHVDHIVVGGDFNASLSPRVGYQPASAVHAADALAQTSADALSLQACLPQDMTWCSRNESRRAVLDFFLCKSCPAGTPPLSVVTCYESPDPRNDHRVVSGTLAQSVVSPLPALDDMKRPVRLRMGAFAERRDLWACEVEKRVATLPPPDDPLARFDQGREAALAAARDIFGETSGGLQSPI